MNQFKDEVLNSIEDSHIRIYNGTESSPFQCNITLPNLANFKANRSRYTAVLKSIKSRIENERMMEERARVEELCRLQKEKEIKERNAYQRKIKAEHFSKTIISTVKIAFCIIFSTLYYLMLFIVDIYPEAFSAVTDWEIYKKLQDLSNSVEDTGSIVYILWIILILLMPGIVNTVVAFINKKCVGATCLIIATITLWIPIIFLSIMLIKHGTGFFIILIACILLGIPAYFLSKFLLWIKEELFDY